MAEKFLFFTIYYRNFKNKELKTLDFMYAGQCGNGLPKLIMQKNDMYC